MKILNINFKNINSLEGDNRIDFERPPFTASGVFAITGPNGSGKSSILDAITLGLYGETFRFDRPAKHVMTQHTTECYSTIEFVLNQEKYRSSWQVQRENSNPETDLSSPEMKLIRLSDNEVLATTPQQVCMKITEITGMNFRNFTRSILLAQGDFAAFLNALDNERMDILEKIISADIYTDYKTEILEKAADAQQRLDYLKQDLTIVPVMDEEKRVACEHDLSDFIEQTAELGDEQSQLKQQQVILEQVWILQSKISDQEKSLRQAKMQLTTDQQNLDQLTEAQDALLFNDQMQVLEEKNHQLDQGKAILAEFQDELKQLQERIDMNKPPTEDLAGKSLTKQQETLTGLRTQIGQLTAQQQSESDLWQSLTIQLDEKTAVLATVSSWVTGHLVDESLQTSFPEIGQLRKLRTELTALTEKQKAVTKWSKNTNASLNNNQAAIAQENKRIAELKRKLPLAEKVLTELAQGRNLAELEGLLQDQQERIKDFRELKNLASANQKLTGSGFNFFGMFDGKEQPDHDIDALESQRAALEQEVDREENIKLTLETAVFRETLFKKMTQDRQHLVDGEPCFLCGATEHPFTEYPPRQANSQQALSDQQTKLKNLIVATSKLSQQLKVAKKQAEKNQANQTELVRIRSQWQTLCNRLYTASEELNINKLSVMKRLLNTEISELKTITSVVSDYKTKQATIEQLTALIAKGLVTIERLQLNTQQLESERRDRPVEENDYAAVLASCKLKEQQLTAQVQAQLMVLGEKMPAKNKEDGLFDRLNKRRQDYQGHIFRQKSLTEDLQALTEKSAHCQLEIANCTEKLQHYSAQLQNEEIIGLHLMLLEKQKMSAEQEHSIIQLEAEVSALKQGLQDKIQGTQFTSLDELSGILEQLQHQSELEQHLAELEQVIEVKTLELEQERLKLDNENAQLAPELNSELLDAQLKSISEKMAIADLETQRLEQLLKEQKQFQQKAEAIEVQLQEQQELVHQYSAEVVQIAEETGMDFRRRVQKRVAEQLLSQTNAVLEKISGRYYLRQIFSEQGLALEIEDTYQGNAHRLPKTLSGGESFVVSLALALGLSELANNGKSVDSLFLDEGFGNLDAETLYTVISTLEGLHTHGKTVGVISHVEGVQKRFKAQLQLVKKPNGLGMLKQL